MKRLIVLGLMAASLLVGSSVQAFEVLSPDNAGSSRIEAGQSVDDTVITAGQSVDIRGPISKDLFAAGSSVTVDSPVGGNVVAAGATVTINSSISGGLIIAGGTIKLDRSAVISGDVMVFGGTVEISGRVDGNVQVFGGLVSISGTVTGNVTAQADKVLLGESATIGGNLSGTLGSALAENAASHVKGSVDVSVGQPDGKDFSALGAATGLGLAAGLLAELYGLLTVLVGGLALLLGAPKFLETFRKRSHAEPLTSGLVGLALCVGTPIVFILCLVFFITIPLGFFALALLTIVGLLGSVAGNLWAGDLVGSRQWSPLLTLAVGTIILALLGLIPVVGILLQFIAWLVGTGSIGYTLWHQLLAGKGK